MIARTTATTTAKTTARTTHDGASGGSGATPLLLDLFSSTTAYSLRKLRAEQVNCVRVRRSSDSEEQDFGFSGLALDTAAVLSFCGAGDGCVVKWYDQSGNGNDAYQTVSTSQPKIVNAGVLATHNGTDDACINIVDSSAAAVTQHFRLSNPYEITDTFVGLFSVYSLRSSGNNPYILGSNPPDKGFIALHSGATYSVRTATVRSGGMSVANGTVLTANTKVLRFDLANRTAIQTYLNGSGTPAINIADRNENFQLATECYLGNNTNNGLTSNTAFSEFIFFTTDVFSSKSIIEEDINASWSVYS